MIPGVDLQSCVLSAWQAAPDLGLRVIVVAGLLTLAGWAAAQRFFPGQRAFVGLQVCIVAWVATTSAEHAAVDAVCKSTIALLEWPAIILQPVLWTLFLHQYVHSETRPPSARVVALVGLPALLLTLGVLSNGEHGLMYGAGTALGAPIAGLPRMRYDYGPLFVTAAAWGYAWLAVAAFIVLQAWWQSAPPDRGTWLAFIVMMAVPWAANMAYLGFGVRLLGGDPTPLSFAAAVIGFAWLIRNDSLFKVVPLARRLLFSELPDPVLVIDPAGRVMDANTAAAALAGGAQPRALPLAAWPRFGADLAAALERPAAGPLMLADPDMVLEVRVRNIGEADRQAGRLVQLRDVTERHRAQARMVQTLAERNAQLQQVALLQAKLREQALRDPLTGLHNRRALEQRFAVDAKHAAATHQPLTLVVLDLDHFKRINDSGGHAAGDAVLRAVATLMHAALRSTDTSFRIGGEEFAILLPGVDAEAALPRLHALQQALASATPPVTFSAGVASLGPHGNTLDDLMRVADDALYRAKDSGRDRVLVGPGLHGRG